MSLVATGADEAAKVRGIIEGSFTVEICFETGRVFKHSISGDYKNQVIEWSLVFWSVWLSLTVAAIGLAIDGKLFQCSGFKPGKYIAGSS